MAAEVKMAAKLVNLGFGFGPQRNPRSGPPRVSREGGGGREAGGGKGEEERAREGRGREGKGSGYGVGSSRATHIYPPLCD